MTKITYIPGEIANAAIDEHGNRKPVTRTQHIFDDAEGKSQADINAELVDAVGPGGSVDERIAAEGATHYLKSETYNKAELNNLITTPNQKYMTVATYSSLPVTGQADTIYRVSNYDGSTNQVDVTKYSEYAWDGTQYIFLEVKTQIGEVFDISQYNANAEYTDIADALGTNGEHVPTGVRRGGMSVKFKRSTTHKYVQYRLESNDWSIDPNDWVIDELTQIRNNPEYATIFLDGARKVLKAITKLGLEKVFIPVKFLGGISAPEIDAKVDKEDGKSLIDRIFACFIGNDSNPEYIHRITDNNNKVAFGVKRNGKTVLHNDELDMLVEKAENNIPTKGKKLVGVEYFGGWDGVAYLDKDVCNEEYHNSPLFDPNSQYYDPEAANYENWYDYVYFKEGIYPPTHATFYLWYPQFAPVVLPSRKPLLEGGFRCDSVSRMEAEIELASQYNIDYFLFCFYTFSEVWNEDDTINVEALRNEPLNSCVYNYINASNKGLVKMALMLETGLATITKKRAYNLLKYINDTFVDRFYFQYVDGLPLLAVYGSGYYYDSMTNVFGNYFTIFNNIRYSGNGIFEYTGGIIASSVGQSYNSAKDAAYIQQYNRIGKKEKYFINAQVGNDKRPWLADAAWSTYKWVASPSKNDFKQALLERMKIASKYNGDVSIVIYAWNELGEGGWLLPTEGEVINGQPDMFRLEAIKEAKEEWLNN